MVVLNADTVRERVSAERCSVLHYGDASLCVHRPAIFREYIARARETAAPTRLAQIESISDFGREFFSLWWITDDRRVGRAKRVKRARAGCTMTTYIQQLRARNWNADDEFSGVFALDVCTAIQNHAAWLVNGIISDTEEHGIHRCPGSLDPLALLFPAFRPSSSVFTLRRLFSLHYGHNIVLTLALSGNCFSHSSLGLRLGPRSLWWWIIRNSTCLKIV